MSEVLAQQRNTLHKIQHDFTRYVIQSSNYRRNYAREANQKTSANCNQADLELLVRIPNVPIPNVENKMDK